MLKHEWIKKEKEWYMPPAKPQLVEIPVFNFVSITGEGNPNTPAFAECIGALYALSYTLKMGLKKRADKPLNYQDYTVYPLEGIWDLNDKGRRTYIGRINKDDLERACLTHREIYLSDFRRVATEKLKTVLRFKVNTFG